MKEIMTAAFMALGVTAAEAQTGSLIAINVLPGCKAIMGQGQAPVGDMLSCAYVVGDAMGTATFLHSACVNIPKGATYNQVVLISIRYIEARPQRMHEPLVNLIVDAMHDAWPCKPTEAH